MAASVLRRNGVPLGCALLAVLLCVAAMIPSLRPADWSLTVLPRVAAGTGMAAAAKARDPGFHIVGSGAYDGQFYWGIAVDPLGRGSVHQVFDRASYRYGHPLYGWLGWLGSAGHARAAPAALVAVSLLSMLVAAAAAAVLGIGRGRGGWEGLFVALNPGLLYSGSHDLTEPLSAALMLSGLAAYLRGRRTAAVVLFALVPLTKEPLVVVPLAAAGWELWRRRAWSLDAGLYAASLLPSVLWWTYARIHFGEWFTSGDSALGAPFVGWKRALLDAGVYSYVADPLQNQLGEVTIVVLVALLGLLTVAGLFALRLRGPAALVYLPLAILAVCLAPNATVLLRDALRNTSLLVVLVPFVIASPPLLPMWWARRGGRSSTERPLSRV